MEGRGGNDTIYGGTELGDAGHDTAVFTGNQADYTVTRTGPGVYTVADSVLDSAVVQRFAARLLPTATTIAGGLLWFFDRPTYARRVLAVARPTAHSVLSAAAAAPPILGSGGALSIETAAPRIDPSATAAMPCLVSMRC